MIPAAQLDALRRAADVQPEARKASEHLDEITSLLSRVLPELEARITEATRGPTPLDAAAQNLVLAGGKRLRPLTTFLVTSACGGEPLDAMDVAIASELVHSATLLHDDVLDEGEQRRGRPTSRVVWGNLVSVLAGDLLLTRALEIINNAGIPGAMADLLETMHALIAGEVAQLVARNQEQVRIDHYFQIVRGKTASLFAFACRAGARAAKAGAESVAAAGRFGEHVGIAFQIVDDVLDLQGEPKEAGKKLGVDLADGKTTLPLALALEEDERAIEPLLKRARTGDAEAIFALRESRVVRTACAKARQLATQETHAGLAQLSMLPASRARDLLTMTVEELTLRRA